MLQRDHRSSLRILKRQDVKPRRIVYDERLVQPRSSLHATLYFAALPFVTVAAVVFAAGEAIARMVRR